MHHLVQTNKWRFPRRRLQVVGVVIITEKSTPLAYWPLARVTSVNADRSVLACVVTIKTVEFDKKDNFQKSSYIQLIHKLIYFLVDAESADTYFSFIPGVELSKDYE